MVKAMNTKVGNSLRKLVLIKLADNANDQGECWPSHSYIADQCECSKSAVKTHIADLIKSGLLTKENRLGGEKGNKSNIYVLQLDKSMPSEDIGVGHQKAQGGSPENLGWVTRKHRGGSSESYRTSHIEPVNEPLNNKKINKKDLDLSKFSQPPDKKVWTDYLEHRKNKKAKLTQTALNRLAEEINKANAMGYSTDTVLAECMLRNWQGFKVWWMVKDQQVKAEKINQVSTRPSNPAGFVVVNR